MSKITTCGSGIADLVGGGCSTEVDNVLVLYMLVTFGPGSLPVLEKWLCYSDHLRHVPHYVPKYALKYGYIYW